MPFSRPTLTALQNQAIQDVTTSGVPGLTGLLRNAVLRVLAWCQAGLVYSLYGYLDWIARQSVPFTATDEFLTAWAGLIGIYAKDATPAIGQAQFSGNFGVPLPVNTVMTRQDGIEFVSTADGVVDSTLAVTVPVTAVTPGADGNGGAGMGIGLASPIGGINSGGMVLGNMTGGADQESQDQFRTRMLLKYRDPPQGGASGDYINWALEVPGCTRAWVKPQGYGPGSVVVYPMFDDAEAEFGGFPQGTNGCAQEETRGPTATGDQLAVAEHMWPVQPVTALVYIAAPVPASVDVTLLGLDPNTPEMQADIVAALTDMFLVVGEVGGTVYPSDLYEAILATPGVNHFAMTSPALPFVAPQGALPVMGNLTSE